MSAATSRISTNFLFQLANVQTLEQASTESVMKGAIKKTIVTHDRQTPEYSPICSFEFIGAQRSMRQSAGGNTLEDRSVCARFQAYPTPESEAIAEWRISVNRLLDILKTADNARLSLLSSMSPPYIFGWIPNNLDGDIVQIPPSQASQQFTFALSSRKTTASPPTSSPHLPSSSPLLLDTSSPQPEPDKIPRPRNSFIIFRTEFARLHHNPRGTRPRRTSIKTLGRTVSREAGDAWRALPPHEKQKYQRLAELEKERHAILYPDYQYRPKRRENNVSPPSAPRRRPSPALTIRTVHHTPSASDSDAQTLSPPAEQPPSSPEVEQKPSIVDAAIKADRRRSSSVPVTSGEHLYTSTLWGTEELARERWERPAQAKRRSRSVTQEWVNMAPSFQVPEPAFFDPRSPKNALFSPSIYPTPFRAFSPNPGCNTLNPAALFSPPLHMSPLTAVASSLAGWNGEPSISVAPMAPQPIRLNTPRWLSAPEVRYESSSPDFDARDPLTPLGGDFPWPLDPTAQYIFAHDDSKGEGDPVDYARAEALQEYEFGLQERVHGANSAADFTLFEPVNELQY
ncbi:hypothetical protein B0H11DRAFT_1901250 [Mycena galericulata]|nr:hypothetical protein B0H11DRAFT_1901250 [Mycena galericulata]